VHYHEMLSLEVPSHDERERSLVAEKTGLYAVDEISCSCRWRTVCRRQSRLGAVLAGRWTDTGHLNDVSRRFGKIFVRMEMSSTCPTWLLWESAGFDDLGLICKPDLIFRVGKHNEKGRD
jgi:hypothetical protein